MEGIAPIAQNSSQVEARLCQKSLHSVKHRTLNTTCVHQVNRNNVVPRIPRHFHRFVVLCTAYARCYYDSKPYKCNTLNYSVARYQCKRCPIGRQPLTLTISKSVSNSSMWSRIVWHIFIVLVPTRFEWCQARGASDVRTVHYFL